MGFKITGKLPSAKHAERIKLSSNYNGKGFQNLSPTPMMSDDASYWKMIRDFFSKNKEAAPSQPLPHVKTDLNSLRDSGDVLVWFGHSSYFMRVSNRNILVDPVFSGNAAPLSFMVKAFKGTDLYKPEDMPGIDYLIITHDHYDHLDYKTMIHLKSKVKKIYCSLGISSHLHYWGFDGGIINEMDWWDQAMLDEGIKLVAAPSRHFSGRGLKRNQTLWSSFILLTNSHSIYLGGDSGYDHHFRTIGERFGPFDLAILEAGQYNRMWPLIHMMPEETVQAAVDLKAKALMPVHWGKFSLAMHAWQEPVKRVLECAKRVALPVLAPRIGELVTLGTYPPGEEWWNA